MTRWLFVLSAALGLAWSVAGCATRQFVRAELARTEAELRPGVDQLTGDLQEHRTEIRGLAVEVATLGRDGERVTRAAIDDCGVGGGEGRAAVASRCGIRYVADRVGRAPTFQIRRPRSAGDALL